MTKCIEWCHFETRSSFQSPQNARPLRTPSTEFHRYIQLSAKGIENFIIVAVSPSRQGRKEEFDLTQVSCKLRVQTFPPRKPSEEPDPVTEVSPTQTTPPHPLLKQTPQESETHSSAIPANFQYLPYYMQHTASLFHPNSQQLSSQVSTTRRRHHQPPHLYTLYPRNRGEYRIQSMVMEQVN